MAAQRDAVEWLRMMAQLSPLTDSKPHFARIADEMEGCGPRSPPYVGTRCLQRRWQHEHPVRAAGVTDRP